MQLYVVTYSIVLAVLMGSFSFRNFFRRNYTESRCDILFIQIRKRQSHKNKDQCRTHHINGNLLDRYVSVYCDITYLDREQAGSHTLMSMLNSYTIYNVTLWTGILHYDVCRIYSKSFGNDGCLCWVSAIMGSPNIAICIPFFFILHYAICGKNRWR